MGQNAKKRVNPSLDYAGTSTAARYPISHEADGPSSIAGWAGHHLNHYQLAGSIKIKGRDDYWQYCFDPAPTRAVLLLVHTLPLKR